MAKYLLQRFIIMIVMLAALSIIVFITIELPPGDYADRRALDLRSQGVSVTQSDLIAMRHQFGLDRPWYVRYVTWISNIVLHGNFGISFGLHRPVADVLGERVGLTVLLAIATIIFTYGVAIPLAFTRRSGNTRWAITRRRSSAISGWRHQVSCLPLSFYISA